MSEKHDLRKLTELLFDRAKSWWLASLGLKVFVTILGAVLVILVPSLTISSLIFLFIYIFAECSLLRSDYFRKLAEQLQRKLDFRNSFGWSIPPGDIADVLLDVPTSIRNKCCIDTSEDTYFASVEVPGLRRAMENLQESSWWTKHLAKIMRNYCFSITIILLILSVSILLISVFTLKDYNMLVNIGRVVTSALMIVLSLGTIRLVLAYGNLRNATSQIETKVTALFRTKPKEQEIIKLWHEYQLARAISSLIPTKIYRRHQPSLNQMWKHYKHRCR